MEWKKSPDINSHIYSQLAFDSGNKHMQQGNYNLFNKLYWDSELGQFQQKRVGWKKDSLTL